MPIGREWDLTALGVALLAQAAWDCMAGGRLADEARDWLLDNPDDDHVGWSALEAAECAEVSLTDVRRHLHQHPPPLVYDPPLRVVAPLVPRPSPSSQPGWIQCRRCYGLAAVRDVRALMCVTCGKRSPQHYARRQARGLARARKSAGTG